MRLLLPASIIFAAACRSDVEEKVNTAPTLDSIGVDPADGTTTDGALTCSATGSDGDGDAITIVYVWQNEAGETIGGEATLQLNSETVQPTETVTCTALVSDGVDTASDSVSAPVLNTDPVIDAVALSLEEVRVEDAISCSADVSDIDGGEPEVVFSWTVNGDAFADGADLQYGTVT